MMENGNVVMRHQKGLWNSLGSDMSIEITLIRYGKDPGDLIREINTYLCLKPSH